MRTHNSSTIQTFNTSEPPIVKRSEEFVGAGYGLLLTLLKSLGHLFNDTWFMGNELLYCDVKMWWGEGGRSRCNFVTYFHASVREILGDLQEKWVSWSKKDQLNPSQRKRRMGGRGWIGIFPTTKKVGLRIYITKISIPFYLKSSFNLSWCNFLCGEVLSAI